MNYELNGYVTMTVVFTVFAFLVKIHDSNFYL